MYSQSRDGYRRPPQTDVLALFDGYELYEAAQKSQKQADADLEARLITSLVKSHGPASRMVAVLHDNDKLRQAAYKRTGYTVRPMNGDRPAELMSLIGDEVEQMIQNPPRKLIIMGGDAAYGPLCSLAHSRESEVMVWPLDGRTIAPQLKPYVVQPLGDLLPDLRTQAAVVMARLDVENHLYGLKRAGMAVDTKTYLDAVRKAMTDLGDVVSIQATADWKQLRETLGHDYQWEFEESGIKTDYRRNIPGKNTSDVALAGSIHESLERDPKVDVYVIGTGDSDFTPVVEAIHARGKQVYVISLRNSMSRRLAEIADGARYLDDYLPAPIRTHPTGRSESENTTSASGVPAAQLAVTLQVTDFLHRQRWAFAYFNRLPDDMDKAQVRDAIHSGLLQPRTPEERNTVALNPKHPLAQHAQIVLPSLRRCLHYRLSVQRLPYVDTNLLARDMQSDPRCQASQTGQTRTEVAAWLEAAAAAGIVVKKPRPHPKNPNHSIDTWWPRASQEEAAAIPGNAKPPSSETAEATPDTHKPGDAQPQPIKPTTSEAPAPTAETGQQTNMQTATNTEPQEKPRNQVDNSNQKAVVPLTGF
jgi:hypothetical protein